MGGVAALVARRQGSAPHCSFGASAQALELRSQAPPPTLPCHPASLQIEAIERIIGCGQVEQLIDQAKGELILIPEYASWRHWELPPVSIDDDEFVDFYDELEYVNPDSVAYLGLQDLATKTRAEAASRREAGDVNQQRADVNAAAEARKAAAAAAAAAAAGAQPKK